jgi:hypothetical protein
MLAVSTFARFAKDQGGKANKYALLRAFTALKRNPRAFAKLQRRARLTQGTTAPKRKPTPFAKFLKKALPGAKGKDSREKMRSAAKMWKALQQS